MKKALRIAGILLASFAVLLVIGILIEHFRGKRELASYVRALRASGEKLDLADLIPPRPPAESNSTIALLSLTNRLKSLDKAVNSVPPSMQLVAPGRATVSWRTQRWVEDKETNTWEKVELAQSQFASLAQEIRAALERPDYDTGFDYTRGFVDYEPPPQIHGLVKLTARFLAVTTSDALRGGQINEAAKTLKDLVEFVARQQSYRLVMSQLIRFVCARMAMNQTWELLQANDLTESQLASIQEAWSKIDFSGGVEVSLEIERVMSINTFRDIRQSEQTFASQLESRSFFAGTDPLTETWWTRHMPNSFQRLVDWSRRHLYFPLWRFAWSEQDELACLRRWQEIININRLAAEKSWSRARKTVTDSRILDGSLLGLLPDEGEWKKRSQYDHARFVVSGMMFGANELLVLKALRANTEQSLAITALALRRYELRHGRPAPDLLKLVPEFLQDLPRDWMDGQPIRYRRQEGSYVLYSVGADGEDNQGDASQVSKKPGALELWGGRDVVWPSPASEEELQAFEASSKRKR